MGIGSERFQEYNRVLAISVKNCGREADPRNAERERLRAAIATLPWSIPAVPTVAANVRQKASLGSMDR